MPLIGVITVNYNCWLDTLEAARSLEASRDVRTLPIIVDNASRDGSVQQLRLRLPEAEIIRSEVNLGFAGGSNLGIRRAMELGCDYVMFLNVDATVQPDTLAALVEESRKLRDRVVLGSLLRYPTGKFQFIGSYLNPKTGHPTWYDVDGLDRLNEPLITTDFIIGAAMFAPTEIFKAVGLLDERFFLNYEETDWCYRASDAGYQCFMVPRSIVIHRSNATVGGYRAPLQSYFCFRNELLFIDKHATTLQRLRAYKRAAVTLGRSAAKALLKGDDQLRAKALFAATRDYLARSFGDCPDEIREYARRYAAGER